MNPRDARDARDFAAIIAQMQRQISDLQRAARLGNSSIEDGTLDVYDDEGTTSLAVGKQYDGTYVAATLSGPIPPTPSAPIVAPVIGGLLIRWDGAYEDPDAVAPMDFARVEVHLSDVAGFTPDLATTLRSSIGSPRGEEVFIPVDLGTTWWAALVTRTLAGKASEGSAQTSGEGLPLEGPTSDGNPPDVSPDPTVIGGVGVLHVRWPAITNNDPVTYQVHVSTVDGFTPDATTLAAETAATAITIKTLADGTPLDYGPEAAPTVYYVRLVATDADGAAAPSGQASGSLHRIGTEEVSALYGYFGEIVADQIIGGTLSAEVTLSGAFKTADAGRRVVTDALGVHLYASDGSALVDLPTDPEADASFNGSATMRNLTITESMALASNNNHIKTNATAILDASIGPPATGPGFAIGYDQFTVTGIVQPPNHSGVSSTNICSAMGFHIDADEILICTRGDWDSTWGGEPKRVAIAPAAGGAVTGYWYPYGSGLASIGNLIDVCALGSGTGKAYYTIGHPGLSGGAATDFKLRRFDSTKTMTHEVTLDWMTYLPYGLFTDGTYIYVLCNTGDSKFHIRRYSASNLGGMVETSSSAAYWSGTRSGGYGGAAGNFDYGAFRLVIPGLSNTYANYLQAQTYSGTSNYVLQANESWPSSSLGFSGIKWDPATSRFVGYYGSTKLSGQTTSQVTFTRYSGTKWTAATDATWWLSADYAYHDGSDVLQYQTPQSPRTKLTMLKRANLVITGPALPPNDPVYAYDPNWARIFIGKGTSDPGRAAMYYQGRTNTGVPSITVTDTPGFTGTDNPPTGANFPDATPGRIVSTTTRADGAPRTSIAGDGTANIDGLLPPGSITMFGGGSTPTGWLVCNGQVLSRVAYPDLFTAIGTAYNTGGEASSDFRLPNFTDIGGRFPIGAGTKALGASGGGATKTLAPGNLPAHAHAAGTLSATTSGSTHQHTVDVGNATPGTVNQTLQRGSVSTPVGGTNAPVQVSGSHNHDITGSTADQGSGTAFDVMNPWVAVNFLIKT